MDEKWYGKIVFGVATLLTLILWVLELPGGEFFEPMKNAFIAVLLANFTSEAAAYLKGKQIKTIKKKKKR